MMTVLGLIGTLMVVLVLIVSAVLLIAVVSMLTFLGLAATMIRWRRVLARLRLLPAPVTARAGSASRRSASPEIAQANGRAGGHAHRTAGWNGDRLERAERHAGGQGSRSRDHRDDRPAGERAPGGDRQGGERASHGQAPKERVPQEQ